MNAAVRAVVRTAVSRGIDCVGIRRGWNGLINSDFINMDASSVSHIIDKGGTMLYTARSEEFMQESGRAKALATCKLLGLDADDIPHPRLEAVFTVDEEIGMLGATALDVSMLRGRRMLNLDSEEEGVFTVGCAGGNLTQCTLPLTRAPYAGKALTVTVGGLRGGHSGAARLTTKALQSFRCLQSKLSWTMA